jgi:hypothetical protein
LCPVDCTLLIVLSGACVGFHLHPFGLSEGGFGCEARRRKQVEKERRGAASRAFWSMVMSSLRRRSLLALWPDVFALPTLQKAHQEVMAELQAAQLANALFLPFLSQSNAQV